MYAIDEIDRNILRVLQEDGRITNSDLAQAVNLSPSACLRRVKTLEVEGVIEKYVALVNQASVGRRSTVFVEMTLTSQQADVIAAFEAAIKNCVDVMECHLVSGNADYLVRIHAADTEDYERIHKTQLSHLPGVARIRSNFALRRVCKKTAIRV